MRNLKVSILLIGVALSVAAVGSAALSSIAFDRSLSAGQVLADTDPNVAVQITNISPYSALMKTGTDGQVSFDLNAAVNNNLANGFNTDATYSIGTASSGVIKIKNNSDLPVTVTLANDAGNVNAVTLHATSATSPTIGSGASSDFYFTLDTNNQDAVKNLKAVLSIKGEAQ